MQPLDAKRLFVLSQTDPDSVPKDINAAMHMAIYDEIESYFYLNSIHNDEFGVLPASEYLRLQEILTRMAWVDDRFLKATNLIYRGLVSLNLAQKSTGLNYVSVSCQTLSQMLTTAKEKLSRKRILRTRAIANAILGELLKAETDHFSILKLDPQDWNALMDLSYLLNKRGKCPERGIWIEASIKRNQDQFDIVIHCGNQQLTLKNTFQLNLQPSLHCFPHKSTETNQQGFWRYHWIVRVSPSSKPVVAFQPNSRNARVVSRFLRGCPPGLLVSQIISPSYSVKRAIKLTRSFIEISKPAPIFTGSDLL